MDYIIREKIRSFGAIRHAVFSYKLPFYFLNRCGAIPLSFIRVYVGSMLRRNTIYVYIYLPTCKQCVKTNYSERKPGTEVTFM